MRSCAAERNCIPVAVTFTLAHFPSESTDADAYLSGFSALRSVVETAKANSNAAKIIVILNVLCMLMLWFVTVRELNVY